MTGFNKLVCCCALLEDPVVAGVCSHHTSNLFLSILVDDLNRLKAATTPDAFQASLPSHIRRLNREAPQPRPEDVYTTVIVEWTKLYPSRKESFQKIGRELKTRLELHLKNNYYAKAEPLIWDVYVSAIHSPSDTIDNRGQAGEYCQHRCAIEVAVEAARTLVRDIEGGRFNMVTSKQDYEMNTVHYNMKKLARLPLLPTKPRRSIVKRTLKPGILSSSVAKETMGETLDAPIPDAELKAEDADIESTHAEESSPSLSPRTEQVNTPPPAETPEPLPKQPVAGPSKPRPLPINVQKPGYPFPRPQSMPKLPLRPHPGGMPANLCTLAALYGLPLLPVHRQLPLKPFSARSLPAKPAPMGGASREMSYVPRWLAAAQAQSEALAPMKHSTPRTHRPITPAPDIPPPAAMPTPTSPLDARSKLPKRPRDESREPSCEQDSKKPKIEPPRCTPTPSAHPRRLKRSSPIRVPAETKGTVVDLTADDD